jgi:hypothetical protein
VSVAASKDEQPLARAATWAQGNWDTLIALVLAAVFAVLGAIGGASDDVVRGATLAVLALLATALIRLRSAREETKSQIDRLQGSVRELNAGVAAIDSGTPWRILDSELVWDLQSRELAKYTKTRKMHFYRNDVMSVHDWFSAQGWSDNERSSPGTFLTERKFKIGEREYSLILFRNFYKRGDEVNLVIQRDVHESFPAEQNEYVNLAVREETARARLKVIWPGDKPPTRLWLQGNRMANEEIPLRDLTNEQDGRSSFTYEMRDPELGEDVYILWNW